MKSNRTLTIGLSICIFLFLSFSGVHKFYVSVTNVVYSEKSSSFQITSRIFIDDLENVLKERYDVSTMLATPSETEIAEFYIEKYLRAKFTVELDGDMASYAYLGKQYDNDVIILYLEIEKVDLDKTKTLAIQNEILTDLFDEQQNIVHVKWKGNKRSFVLLRENNKGMLNL